MQCPICSAQTLVPDIRDMKYVYKGEQTTILAASGQYCPACGEAIFDAQESARISAAMVEFNKQVNAAAVDPKYIASIRKRLKLEQKEAAEIFGGGVNAFSRYESGKTRPPLALVKLLKILDAHPELLPEVRA